MHSSRKKWLQFSLFNLMLVALLGVTLRYKIAFSLPFIDQQNLLHGHSHFAFAGWVTQALMTLLVGYLSEQTSKELFSQIPLDSLFQCHYGIWHADQFSHSGIWICFYFVFHPVGVCFLLFCCSFTGGILNRLQIHSVSRFLVQTGFAGKCHFFCRSVFTGLYDGFA